jgi:hypothetical protein
MGINPLAENALHGLTPAEQAPDWAMDTPAPAASHSLPYVKPSQPHTGVYIESHAPGIALQVPAPPHSPTGPAQYDPFGQAVASPIWQPSGLVPHAVWLTMLWPNEAASHELP